MKKFLKYLIIGLFALGLTIFPTPGILYAWTGSDQNIGLNTPDAVTDNSIIRPYFGALGWCWNNTSVPDYYDIWVFEDINADTIINQVEVNSRQVYKQEDFNRATLYNQRLAPRSQFKGVSGKKYWMFIRGVSINGTASSDTNIVGLGPEGDASHTDSWIAYFTIQ